MKIYMVIGDNCKAKVLLHLGEIDCIGDLIEIVGEDAAYVDEQKAVDVCNKMNRERQQYDPTYLVYVTGPIPLY